MNVRLLILLLFISVKNVSSQQIPVSVQKNPFAVSGFSNLDQAVTKQVANNLLFYKTNMPGIENSIPISIISGSRFWNDQWKMASLFNRYDKVIARIPVKLNLNNSTIHYTDSSGEEKAIDPDYVRKVVFHTDANSSDIEAVFVSFIPYVYASLTKVNDYIRVMNQGAASLLKYEQRNVYSSDSALGTARRYYFKQEIYYYIWLNNKSFALKKLNKEDIFKLLPGADQYKSWLQEHHLNLKKEADVVQFINYYNSQNKK